MEEIVKKLKKVSDELFAIKDEIIKAYEAGDQKEGILDEMWNAICGTFAAINRIEEPDEYGEN